MTRAHRVASQPGHRICNRCERELPATAEIFCRDSTRPLGLAYECRECMAARKRGRDRRRERWSNMTADQKAKRTTMARAYAKTTKGRAVFLRKAYERIDACDLTTLEVAAIIEQPCHYCGTTESPRGLDRIDNALAHVKGNVLPCCAPCNFARGDRLTVEEMMKVGAVIRQIMEDRHRPG